MDKVTKFSVALLLTTGVLFASSQSTLSKNIEGTIKEVMKANFTVVDTKKLKGFNQMLFVRLKTPDGREIPAFFSSDGKSFIGFSSVLYSPYEDDNTAIKGSLELAGENNKKYEAVKNQQDQEKNQAAAKLLFESIPSERYLLLNSSNENVTKTIVIVTDPDCPYCRQELQKIESRLATANVKLIFAPVHDDRAFVKSQLIMDESSKVATVEEKIKIIRSYYADIQLTPEQTKIDLFKIKDNAQRIFSSGVVKGVPFVHELDK